MFNRDTTLITKIVPSMELSAFYKGVIVGGAGLV
jgi:hypothetical protein